MSLTYNAQDQKPITVIGGGLVGLATAYRLAQAMPWARVIVAEKEAGVGRHQSTHNSGVLHAGLHYAPGSLKARLAVDGIRRMVAFCEKHGVRHEICGKLVAAVTADEIPRLKELHRRGTANGLAGLRLVSGEEAREREPHAQCVAGLLVPEEGIVDYAGVCAALVAKLTKLGVEIRTNADVIELRRHAGGWRVVTTLTDWDAGFLVNCAGLHADRVAMLAGERITTRIVPFRGEYFRLRAERQHLVRHLVYPVPDPAFPFLGVHFTRMIGGGVEGGPNAILALAREGYGWGDVDFGDLWEALSFPGLWRFMRRYPSLVSFEVRRSLSKRVFCESLQRLVPEIQIDDLVPGGAGVRAQAMSQDGTLVHDFDIVRGERALHVLSAPSPAATASLAIGAEIVARLSD